MNIHILGGYMKNNRIIKLSTIYKMLGDPTRLKIVNTLLEKEISVNAICKKLNMSQSAISHQLQLLKAHNIVIARRIGQVINYRIANEQIRKILEYNAEILLKRDNDECIL